MDGTAILWDAVTGRLLCAFTPGEAVAPGFTVLAFSPDGTRMAAGGIDGTITAWDSATGDVVQTLTGHTNMVTGLSFSKDGARLASASWDGTAKVWSLALGKEITTFHGHTAPVMVTNVAFSPDGRSVFTSGDDFVRQWDAATGEEIRAFSEADGTVRPYTLQLEELVAPARSRLTRKLTVEECQIFLHAVFRYKNDTIGPIPLKFGRRFFKLSVPVFVSSKVSE